MENNKIYCICPNNNFASGGVKQIYRMVDILNSNGFEAYVLHKRKHRESWFTNNSKIIINPYIFKKIKFNQKSKIKWFEKLIIKFTKLKSFKIEENSIFVIPEIYGDTVKNIFENKYVIFNQNCFYSFNNLSPNYHQNIYNSEKNLGVICVSENSKNYLETAFEKSLVSRIRVGIDLAKFYLPNSKKKQIAFMPRKLSDDVKQVISILKLRNQLKNWDFVEINNNSEDEVADILKKSAIFLSFNHQEGLGLPPLEAMACGCYVIGYKGQAGEEYFDPSFSTAIPDGNIIEFVKQVEHTALDYEENLAKYQAKSKMAFDFISKKYTHENEEKDIVAIWKNILKKP